MHRILVAVSAALFLSWAAAQLCYDAAGNSFAGNDVAYFLDQRHNCTIMICRNGTPQVLKQLCDRELNESMIQGVKPPPPGKTMLPGEQGTEWGDEGNGEEQEEICGEGRKENGSVERK